MTTQQHFYSQNTNVIHTQEAQQETNQQNYYDDFGDELEKLGEIEYEELLNLDDQQVEDQEQFYEEYDGPEQEIPEAAVDQYNFKNQVRIETSKKQKNRRRQPSQEPIILAQDNMGQYQGKVQYIPKENEKEIQYISNGTAYIGQNSNTLEQETFLMQHDTFQGQADAADMPDFSTQSQQLDKIDISSIPLNSNNKSIHQQTFQKKLLSQQQQKMVYSLGFQTDIQNKKMTAQNTQINLYQKNSKKEKLGSREDQNEVFYLINDPSMNYIKNDQQNEEEVKGEQPKQHIKKYIKVGKQFILSDEIKHHNKEEQQILIQHITSHSQESDSVNENMQAVENEILIIGNPSRYMKLKDNWKTKKKNSNGLTVGGTIQSTKLNNPRENNYIIGLDTFSQEGHSNKNQGGQQTFMQQYNTYQDSRDQMMEALNLNQGGFQYNIDAQEKETQKQTQLKKSKSQVSQIPIKQQKSNASTQQILNTLNFQNSRALNHEIALNQMQKNLLEQFQRMKEMKKDVKIKKLHVEEQIKQNDQKKKDLEDQSKKLEEKQIDLKQEKKIMKIQNQKLLEIHKQYVELLKNKYSNQKEIYAPIEVSDKLTNIQTVLELILKNKQSQESNSSQNSDLVLSKKEKLKQQSLQVLLQVNQKTNDTNNLQQIIKQEEDNRNNEAINIKQQMLPNKNEYVYPQVNYQASLSQQIYLNDQSQIQEFQQPQQQLQQIVQQYQSKLDEINQILRNLQLQNQQLHQNNYINNKAVENIPQLSYSQTHYQQLVQQTNGQQLILQGQPQYQHLISKPIVQNPSNLLSYERTTHQPIMTIGATPTETVNSSIDHTLNNQIVNQQRILHQHSSQISNMHPPITYFTPIQGSYNLNYEMINSKHNFVIDQNNQNYPHLQQQDMYNRQVNVGNQNAFDGQMYNQITNDFGIGLQTSQEEFQKFNQNQQSVAQDNQISYQDINKTIQTLKSKNEMRKQSTEVQSEFVFDPDPDFLSKINQNIRQNNQIIEETFKIPENQFQISPQKEQIIINNILIQKKQQNESKLNEDQNRKSTNNNQFEREKLISCGSDIQIVEAEQQENEEQKAEDNGQEMYLRQQLYLLQEQQFQHAYTDRNHLSSSQNSLQNFKDNQGQATQIDIMFEQQQRNNANTQEQNAQRQLVDPRNMQQNSGRNSSKLSQIPSSQMSVFQSIQQKLNRIIGSNVNQSNINQSSNIKENLTNNNYQSNFMYSNNGSQPDNNEHFYLQGKSYGVGNDQRDSEGEYQNQRKLDQNHLISSNQILNKNLQYSSSFAHSPSIGQSPAIIIQKQSKNEDPKIGLSDQPIKLVDLQINNQLLKQNDVYKIDQKHSSQEKQKPNIVVKKIEEDEILRLIHESQEAQEWSESQSYNESSQYDTFHKRPQPADFKPSEAHQDLSSDKKYLQKQNQLNPISVKHLQNPSIEYNEKGEIYDQPKKAIYGIKIAKNAF